MARGKLVNGITATRRDQDQASRHGDDETARGSLGLRVPWVVSERVGVRKNRDELHKQRDMPLGKSEGNVAILSS